MLYQKVAARFVDAEYRSGLCSGAGLVRILACGLLGLGFFIDCCSSSFIGWGGWGVVGLHVACAHL